MLRTFRSSPEMERGPSRRTRCSWSLPASVEAAGVVEGSAPDQALIVLAAAEAVVAHTTSRLFGLSIFRLLLV